MKIKKRAGEWRAGIWYPSEAKKMNGEDVKKILKEGSKKKRSYNIGLRAPMVKDPLLKAVAKYREAQATAKKLKAKVLRLIEGEK